MSPAAVARTLVDLTATKLTDFPQRSLADCTPFAVCLDPIHRGGEAVLVALGVDGSGQKMALGLWHGSAEHHESGEALFRDLARRGLARSTRILFVTDGGNGSARSSCRHAAPFLRAGTCRGPWPSRIGPRRIGGS